MNELRADAIRCGKVWAYVALTKPDVTFLVVITTVAGFYLGSNGPMDWLRADAHAVRHAARRRRHRGAESIRRARHGCGDASHGCRARCPPGNFSLAKC